MLQGFCWKCHQKCEEVIRFKTVCDACGAYLHACQGCKFHQPGKPNECQIPNTDQVRDRGHFNYCDEFKALSESIKDNKPSVDDIAKRLFKD